MRRTLCILAILLAGCSGMAISVTYTPPVTVGVTFDARPLYPPTTQPRQP